MRGHVLEVLRRAVLGSMASVWLASCQNLEIWREYEAQQAASEARPPKLDPSAQALKRAEESARRESARAALAASAVRKIREESVSIAAPAESIKHLAFGKRFLIQGRGSRVMRFDSETGKELSHLESGAVQGVLGLPYGSVLVLTTRASFRFDPAPSAQREARHIALWPGSRLEPVPNAPDRVFLVDGLQGRVERRVLFSEELIAQEAARELPGYRGGPLTTLRDGSLFYLVRGSAFRGHALLAKRTLRPSRAARVNGLSEEALERVFRARAADTPNRVWLVDARGETWLVECRADELELVRHFATGQAPLEFAATAARLVFVSVQEGHGPRRFALHVYDPQGRELFIHDLGVRPATNDADWVAGILSDFELAVAQDLPRVAVGSTHSIGIWDLDSGRPIGVDADAPAP